MWKSNATQTVHPGGLKKEKKEKENKIWVATFGKPFSVFRATAQDSNARLECSNTFLVTERAIQPPGNPREGLLRLECAPESSVDLNKTQGLTYGVWREVWDSALLRSSQEMLMLLGLEPGFKQQSSRAAPFSSNAGCCKNASHLPNFKFSGSYI